MKGFASGCLLAFAMAMQSSFASSADAAVLRSEVRFVPTADEANTAERFRLAEHTFGAEMEPVESVSQSIGVWKVRFPSPVATPHAENNIVHCEYFRPLKVNAKTPGVVVLHILGGDFDLARLVCRKLADRGVAALFVKMPYYGERRPADLREARMVSLDPRATVRGMQQAVLDIRRAAAWLGSRDEIDPERLGITGISLGAITSALAASAEPRFRKVGLVLAGGDIAAVAWDSPHVAEIRKFWLSTGETEQSFIALMKTVDPVTYADRLRGRRIYMVNALYDNEIPVQCSRNLWESLGRPPIHWLEADHYSAMRYLFDILSETSGFFAAEKWE